MTYEFIEQNLVKTTDEVILTYPIDLIEEFIEKYKYKDLVDERWYADGSHTITIVDPSIYLNNLVQDNNTEELEDILYEYSQRGLHYGMEVIQE